MAHSRLFRYLPVPLLLAAVTALAGTFHSANVHQIPAPSATTTDPGANRLLERALARYGAAEVAWLSTRVRQQVYLLDFTFDAEGIQQQAPGNRFRTELRTRQGEVEGLWLVVGDGIRRWQARRAGTAPWAEITAIGFDTNLPGITSAGIVPLLRDLHSRLDWTSRDQGRQKVVHLTGKWKSAEAERLAPVGQPWPNGLPAVCCLDLDSHTDWPQRLEWWGPLKTSELTLLAVVDFETPVINQPLSDVECARLFTFDPTR